MFLGLRSPCLDGQAFVLSVALDGPSSSEVPSRQQSFERYALPLGEGAGIRDLAAVAGRRAGPERALDRRATRRRSRSGCGVTTGSSGRWPTFAHLGEAKAEGLLVLGDDGRQLELLVLFDGVEQGRPPPVRLPRPA